MSKNATKNPEPTETAAPIRPERDPLSAFGHEMLTLFRGPLAEVRFPDLDRGVLESGADALLRAQCEVEATERTLEEARARARDASAAFVQSATRALAYARVFATGQAELETLLASCAALAGSPMGASREPREPRGDEVPKKKRGRPRKDATTAGLLDVGAGAGASEDTYPADEAEGSIAAE